VESLSSSGDPSETTATRCVASCSDASIRIISPVSGDVITTCLAFAHRRLLSAAYARDEGAVMKYYFSKDYWYWYLRTSDIPSVSNMAVYE